LYQPFALPVKVKKLFNFWFFGGKLAVVQHGDYFLRMLAYRVDIKHDDVEKGLC
jgi:hypothetical protein